VVVDETVIIKVVMVEAGKMDEYSFSINIISIKIRGITIIIIIIKKNSAHFYA